MRDKLGTLCAVMVAATATATVQVLPRDGWANAEITRTQDGWSVRAGVDTLSIQTWPDKGAAARLVVTNTADAVAVDATAAFAQGAQAVCMKFTSLRVAPLMGQDVMVESTWSGASGAKCRVVAGGRDRNGANYWRNLGTILPSPRPRTFLRTELVAEDMRSFGFTFEINASAKAPVLFHGARIGRCDELAPRRAAKAKPELLFHAPFDGTANAAFAKGASAPVREANLEYAPGRSGQAVRLSSAHQSLLAYGAAGNLNPERGTVAFWFRHEWPEKKHLGFRDEDGKNCSRGVLHAPAENGHPGDGSLFLWWWRNRLRADRGDIDGRYSQFDQGAIAENPGVWHHYVLTWDDFGSRLYIDGDIGSPGDGWSPQREAIAYKEPLEFDRAQSVFKTFFVGSKADGSCRLDGLLDDLRIWSAPIGAKEAQTLYRNAFDAILEPDIYYGTEGEPKTITLRIKTKGTTSRAKSAKSAKDSGNAKLGGLGELGARNELTGVRVQLLDAAGAVVAESSPVMNGTCTLSATLPRGEYSFALPEGFLCRPVPYWVLGRGNSAEEPPSGRPGLPSAQRLLYAVTPDLATLTPDAFRSVGTCRMGELGGVKYLEAGPKQGDRFALRLSLDRTAPLHCIEIDYPDDGCRTMDVIVQSANNPYGKHIMDVGRYGGREVPVSGKILTHRCLYWAADDDVALIAMTARPDAPAAIAAVRVYAVPSGALPATPVQGGGPGAGERRHYGSYWEDNAINGDYGVNHSSVESLDTLINRKAAYMKYLGQDTLAYPGSWYHGLIAHEPGGYNRGNHSRHFLQAWFEKFDHEGLRLVPTINQQTIPIGEGVVTRASMSDGSLHPTTIAIWDTGRPSWGKWHTYPPNFCIAHPDVQREFLRVFDAIVADGAGHPSFAGICLHLTSINCLWWGGIESGYNDYCIDAFTRATGVKVPVDRSAPLRGRAYAEWLKANAYDKWVQWRCDVLADFYEKLAKRLAGTRPDLKLWVNAMPQAHPTDPDYAQEGYGERLMREAGIDAAQLALRIPNLVMGTGVAPCGFRYEGGKYPEGAREKFRTFYDAPGCYSAFRPDTPHWLQLNDSYWESTIGQRGQLSGDWLREQSWRCTVLQASGRNAMKYYAVPFLFHDIQGMSSGGFLEGTYGMEDMLARFAQSFRALPAVNFPTLAADGQIVLRGGEAEGRSWFYVVNADEKPARVALRVPAGTRDLATGEAVGARDGGAVALNLEPYDFRSFSAPDGTPALER